jgi:hypothetical protein
MEQHSRPASFDDLKALIRTLNQNGADRMVPERALAVLNLHSGKQ